MGMETFLSYIYAYLASQNELDVEPFAILYFSWVTAHPLIMTRCCKRKVCHRCQSAGHHEEYGGSCAKASAMSSVCLTSTPCPKCNVSLVKTEGCSSVTCPMCWHKFRWNRSTHRISAWLQRMRGNGSRAPPVGTVRGTGVSKYIRTQNGWSRITN